MRGRGLFFSYRGMLILIKYAMFYLLGWSQVYPWFAGQILPILAFWTIRHGWESIDWMIPIWMATTVFTLGAGAFRALAAFRLGAPELRRRPGWLLFYLLAEPLFYAPLKNVIARMAQVRELLGEKPWKVTPRAEAASAGTAP